MIEIGKPSENRMSYADAVLYCFCLGDNWRMPTRDEYKAIEYVMWYTWYKNDDLQYSSCEYHVIPVRDIEPTIFNRILCLIHPRFKR